MSGPAPKPSGLRQRRNKTATAAQLPAEPRRRRAPKLPDDRVWHPMTVAWWRDVWRSPMADEYLRSDVHGLTMLAVLVNSYWLEPSTKLLSEIRLQGQCFGLTPVDRRRLQWEVSRAETAERRRTTPVRPTPVADPRSVLHAV